MKKRVCKSVCLVLIVALWAGLTGCRAAVETSGNDEKAASNQNTLVPDLSAASERVRGYIEKSRAEVLAELRPTEDQLARARRLHKSAIVCDLMGGVRDHLFLDSQIDQPNRVVGRVSFSRSLGKTLVGIDRAVVGRVRVLSVEAG